MKFYSYKLIISAIIIFAASHFALSDPSNSKVYPVPPENENSLFYIQRTKNTNAIVYEINYKTSGVIDAENPIKIFWIRYATDSTIGDLTSIQRTYAYGVHTRKYNGQNNAFVVQLVAYKKRNIFLLPVNNSKKYAAFMSINDKFVELKKIFVATSGGTFWFPKVDYVELSGKDPATQQLIVERFVP